MSDSIENISAQNNWTKDTLASLLVNFLEERGLTNAAVAYLNDVVDYNETLTEELLGEESK